MSDVRPLLVMTALAAAAVGVGIGYLCGRRQGDAVVDAILDVSNDPGLSLKVVEDDESSADVSDCASAR